MINEYPARPTWRLNQVAFDRLLNALAPDPEDAGNEYLRIRRNLVRFFETRGFSSADEAADEVLNRLARKLEGGMAIENVSTYALGVARMVALELRKSPESKTVGEIPETIAANEPETDDERDSSLDCLDRCLDELPEENRELILEYYKGERREKIESRERMAERLGVGQNALRNRAVRLRNKLETCITNCISSKMRAG